MKQEQTEVPPEVNFTFNEKTKIYQVNMGTHTYDYILEDEQNRKLFSCCKSANEFKEKKFYKLADEEYKRENTRDKQLVYTIVIEYTLSLLLFVSR